jgi:hypothetical protein
MYDNLLAPPVMAKSFVPVMLMPEVLTPLMKSLKVLELLLTHIPLWILSV